MLATPESRGLRKSKSKGDWRKNKLVLLQRANALKKNSKLVNVFVNPI